jgi:hypothetical protein
MKNTIPQFENTTDLIEEDPFNNNYQSQIRLSIDWENEEIGVGTYYNDNCSPMDVWHGLRRLILLPNNVDPRYLKEDVDELLPRIEKIRAGYESYWDGHNWKGRFNDDAQQELYSLEYDIEQNPYNHFHLLEEGGLWDADEWFVDRINELTAKTTDSEIKDLAESYEYDAKVADGVIIRGGLDAIIRRFRDWRDELIDAVEELVTLSLSGPGAEYSRDFTASGFAVIGDDESKQKIVKPQGTGARVDVPKDWIGSRVIVIRLD